MSSKRNICLSCIVLSPMSAVQVQSNPTILDVAATSAAPVNDRVIGKSRQPIHRFSASSLFACHRRPRLRLAPLACSGVLVDDEALLLLHKRDEVSVDRKNIFCEFISSEVDPLKRTTNFP